MLALFAAPAMAVATPAFDPRKSRSGFAGPPSHVLVLGTPHLSQLPKPLDPALLEPWLVRLATFRPDIITVEAVSGEQCDQLLRFKAQHGSAWDDYCWATDSLEKETGLTVPAALQKIEETLGAWPAQPSPADRRRLAMLFIAANDRGSAMVQWLRLPPGERRVGDGLSEQMVTILDRKGKPLNENYAIAAALAARLGLERLYSTDDHSADTPDAGPEYGKAIEQAWRAPPRPQVHIEQERRAAKLTTSEELLAYYRFLNGPATQRATIAGDMGRAAAEPSQQRYGRQYLGWWETRNLRMVANIRSTYIARPGARVLAIVGATHKGYFDAYLDMMQDTRLEDIGPYLR